MPQMVLADLGHRILNGANLAGLILGILGSLFFAYDLMGRPGGLLRRLLQIGVPGLIGFIVLGSIAWLIGFLVAQADPSFTSSSVALFGLTFAALGASIGTFNGLFVDAPGAVVKRRFAYSLRDALTGFAALLFYVALVLALWGLAFQIPLTEVTVPVNVVPVLVMAGVGGVIAGFWRAINRSRNPSASRPRLFSGKGLLIGMGTGLILSFVALLALLESTALVESTGAVDATTIIGLLIVALVTGLPGGGITGGFSRYIFWWANALPPRELEIIGVFFILLAFVAQAVQPFLGLFEIIAA